MKYTKEELIEHAVNSVRLADQNQSKLTKEILNMDGMSGIKTRHLYNNICSLNNANYLEIGTWKGSSFVSSTYNNDINAIAVDNWSEFNGDVNTFKKNMELYCPNFKYKLIEKNSFDVTKDDLGNDFNGVDIYLYDGAHDYESQFKAISYFYEYLSKYSIIIIDDWRCDNSFKSVQ